MHIRSFAAQVSRTSADEVICRENQKGVPVLCAEGAASIVEKNRGGVDADF